VKKKIIAISVSVVASISLGYLFILGWLLGLLVSRYVAGKSPGDEGRLKSIVLPFHRWRIHIHHWLYSIPHFPYQTGLIGIFLW